jgi:superkiller protein 3
VPAVSLELLAVALRHRGAQGEAAALLRDGRGRHPADFWIHLALGDCLHDPLHPDPATLDEALGCFWAAVALRPGSAPAHSNLGNALRDKGRLEEAIAECLQAIAIEPKYALAHYNLGVALAAKGRLEEAIAEFRRAKEIDPRYALACGNLGNALVAKGRLDEAIAAFQEAIEIDPNLAPAHHYNLGNALVAKGRLDEAIAAYQKAIAIDPKNAKAHTNLGPRLAKAHTNLGAALAAKGRLDEAIAALQKATAIDPKYAQAHGALGRALLQRGRFAAARDATRRALDLLPEHPPLRAQVTQQLQACERLLALDEKLSAILKGDAQPADTTERLLLAELCGQYKQRYVAAARFYADAFAADPKLVGDLQRQHRYNAACSAALAAVGKNADTLTAPHSLALRRQALTWLRADLFTWTRLAAAGQVGRSRLARILTHWQKDADLAGLRDPAALAKLPVEERQACEKLWADVALLKSAKANNQ